MTMSFRHGALIGFAIAFMACASQPTTVKRAAGRKTVVIELYGTKQVTLDHLVSRYGKELRGLCQAKPIEPPTLMADLEALGDFADIEFAPTMYYNAPDKCFLTVDFVDRADAARRMPFGPEPKGVYEDPEGLLADWRAYESKVFELTGAGQMSERRVACPAFHCFGDHSHPAVRQLAARFVELVPRYVEQLSAILRDDRSSSNRADAAFLLAYSNDGPDLVGRMIAASRDPAGIVRNNAMRVLADIAFHHPELDIPFAPVLAALDYPTTLDRNKAGAILAGLLERPDGVRLRVPIAERAGPTLLAMLRLQQPNNHNFAYLILKAISGQSYGERDYAAWEGWLSRVAKS
jgi:hypothetical protein